MKFDRSKISHVPEAEGFAIVNGCQGIFVDWIFWKYEDAYEQWVKNGKFERGLDEQIVKVKISIVEDDGDPEAA